MNHITKRYNIANSIINNGGIKKMLNKIKANIWYYSKSIYSSIYNKVGKFLNRYNPKAITSLLLYLIDDVKTLKDISKGLKNEIIILRKTQGHIIDDVQAIELCINMAKNEHESLKNVHNNLALDVSDFKTRLLKLEDFELRTLKEKAQNILLDDDEKSNVMELGNKLIDTPFKDDNNNDNNIDNCVDEIAKVVYFDYNKHDKQVIKDVIIKHINLTN